MPELLVFPARRCIDETSAASLIFAGDLSDTHRIESVKTDDWYLAATSMRNAPLPGSRVFSNDRWAIVFAGDLIDQSAVPFEQILAALDTERWDFFTDLDGVFGLSAYDKSSRRLYVVSDRRCQKPMYYNLSEVGFHLSSNLASFARLPDGPDFDRTWLWESLYFNFPVGDSTFLEGVKRIPQASILTFDGRTQELSISRYAEDFSPRSPLIGGQEGLELATKVFSERVPAYFNGAEQVACALTGGWDGRTMLALAPTRDNLTAYTYGSPGCNDIVGAAKTANALGVDHIQIPFDRDFVGDLSRHALETVYLSSGQLGVLRSTLHHSYDTLTEGGSRFPLTISGIALDQLFRGHANTPHIVSPDLARHFQGEGVGHDADHWRRIIGSEYENFASHVAGRLDDLERDFGPLDTSAHHLSYVAYRIVPHHFSGELSIADHYTTVRVPSLDTDVIELAFSIEQSTLSYSRFLPEYRPDSRDEMILQSHLFRELAPRVYRMAVNGKIPAAILAGELPFQIARIYHALMRRIRDRVTSRDTRPLEDWSVWLFDQNQTFLEELLRSSSTLVGEHLDPSFIERTIATRDLRMLGKLLTTEIILRLLKTRWQRFW